MLEIEDKNLAVADFAGGGGFFDSFNDLVEHDVLYVAYFPKKAGNSINAAWFRESASCLLDLEPGANALAEVVRVIDCGGGGQPVWLRADATAQQALVFTRGAALLDEVGR